jgi:alkylated DNA repair dioxygenase AlkB
MSSGQPDLFATAPPPGAPAGLAYAPGLIDRAAERELAEAIAALPLKPFEFRGYLGKRRVAYFGRRYDFDGRGLGSAEPMPVFLLRLRDAAAAFAGLPPEAFVHALCTEYAPGAAIGWHRDRPEFGDVVGVSLLAPCSFRLRRRRPDGFDRYAFTAEPRSAYVLRGEARTAWEHSIPEMDALRYSVTFRTLK